MTATKSEKMVEVEIQAETDRLMNLKYSIESLTKKNDVLTDLNQSYENKKVELEVSIENMENHKKELTDELQEILSKIDIKRKELNAMEQRITDELDEKIKAVEAKEKEAEKNLLKAQEKMEIANGTMSKAEIARKQLIEENKVLTTKLKEVENDRQFNETVSLSIKNDKEKLEKQMEKLNAIAEKNELWEKSLNERENKNNELANELQRKIDNLDVQRHSLNLYEETLSSDRNMIEKKRAVLSELQAWLTAKLGNKEISDNILSELDKYFKSLIPNNDSKGKTK